MTRKEQLHDRAEARGARWVYPGEAPIAWEDGYRAALKDVRTALKKGPATLRSLLRPIR